jgi:hypothetical protein
MTTEELLAMAQFSRRRLIQAASAGTAGFTLAQAGFLREAAAKSDTIQDVLDITATVERFGVTFLGEGLQRAKEGTFNKPWPETVVAVVTAARAQEKYHLDTFERAGGKPLVQSFTVPPKFLTDFDAFFTAVVEQETAETAAQVAAMKVFTELKRPDLVKVSFQYGAEETEHRVLANYTRGTRPANDVAFAAAPFATVSEFLDSLKRRGIIGGDGVTITYPGPGEIDPTNVTERTPGGPRIDCGIRGTPGAGASPEASPGGDSGGVRSGPRPVVSRPRSSPLA